MDELDMFMHNLEKAGILSGWDKFMGRTDKKRPDTYIVMVINDDGTQSYYEIRYKCPNCGDTITKYKGKNACDKCGQFFDWGKSEPEIKVTRTVEWGD